MMQIIWSRLREADMLYNLAENFQNITFIGYYEIQWVRNTGSSANTFRFIYDTVISDFTVYISLHSGSELKQCPFSQAGSLLPSTAFEELLIGAPIE